MLAKQIYDEALAADVLLYRKEGVLAYKALQGIPDDLARRIRENKQQILDYLHQLEARLAQPVAPAPALVPLQHREWLPVSRAQRRVWFAEKQAPDAGQFNIQGCFRFDGELDGDSFRSALRRLLDRHEVLRANFLELGGELRQRDGGAREVPVQCLDFSDRDPDVRDALVRQVVESDLRSPFDLEHDVLFRVKLVRLQDREHVAVFNMHHIVSDGWSVGLLIEEFCREYSDCRSGKAPGPGPAPLQYADYAAWQESRLQDGSLEADLAFWRSTLHGLPELHSLPLDRSRPVRQSFDGLSHGSRVDPDLASRIRDFCQGRKLTLFMFLETAFGALLSLYGSEPDVVVGTPVAGRSTPESESMVGLFVNTVVLRNRFDPAASADQLLQDNKRRILAAFERQHVPFEVLVSEVGHKRSMSYSALFQVWFVLQNNRSVSFSLPGCRVSEYADVPPPAAKFDLNLYAREADGGIALDWVFNRGLFEPATIEYLAREFNTLLAGIVGQPGLPIGAHGLFAAPAAAPEPSPAQALPTVAAGQPGLVEALQRRLACGGESTALVANGVAWTYRELAQLERGYRALIAQAGGSSNIGLVFDKGAHVVAAMLAALSLRRTYVNLDPNYPQARLAYMVEHAACDLVLADAGRLPLAQAIAAGRQVAHGPLPVEDAATPAVAIAGNDIAYVLYTSGSTGRPKGVAQSHQNLGYQAESYAVALGFGPGDRILQLASYSFDASVLDTYGGLLSGATVHLADIGASAPDQLLAEIHRQGITVHHSTPTVFKYLFAGATPAQTAGIRAVVLGGERVDALTLETFRRSFGPETRLIGLYGASEASLVTLAEISAADIDAGVSGDLGRAVPGTQVQVRRDDGTPARVYETGRIVVSGRHLAVGYWADPERTAASFIPRGDGVVEYQTGDTGYLLPSGKVRFVGRSDTQVKLNGVRIELGEIEVALRGLDDVDQAAAVIRAGAMGDELTAYVVSRTLGAGDRATGEQALARQYRAGLRAWLPDYMVPGAFVFIERMPLTPSGKTDYRALPGIQPRQREDGYVAPGTDVERRLCELWQGVLGIGRVGIHDDFFGLGGDSLRGLRVLSLVREAFRIELGVRELFTHATVAELARLLESALQEKAASEAAPEPRPLPDNEPADEVDRLLSDLAERGVRIYVENGALLTSGAAGAISAAIGAQIRRLKPSLLARLAPAQAQAPAPAPQDADLAADGEARELSYAQQRLWFLDHFGSGGVSYNMPITLRLEGDLDGEALQAALEAIVARHAVLRTVYRESNGRGVQHVRASAELPLRRIDLLGASGERQDEELARLAETERTRPFDLACDTMMRVTLVRLAEQVHVLHLTLHHIAADGWSLGVLVREFGALYQACRDKCPDPLPPLPMQYADFAALQVDPANQERSRSELPFWREALAGVPQIHGLATDRPRPSQQGARGKVVWQRLDAARYAELKRFARVRHASLFMVLQSTFALLLARWSGEKDIVIGTPTAGRTLPATEAMIGCFVNTLPLRTRLDDAMSYEELLARTRQHLLNAYDHQHVPFEVLVEALNPERSLSHGPLFQVMFALQNYQMGSMHLPGLTIDEIANQAPNAKFDLGVIVHEQDEALLLNWVFADALFDESTIEGLAAGFDALLQAVVDAPEGNVFDLPMQDAAAETMARTRAQACGQCVLDERGRILPAGAVGEIHQRDAGDGAWRATGRVGRGLASGGIRTLAWRGGQTHVKGVRIDTVPIEEMLAGLPGVASACVAVRRQGDDEAAQARVVAYVVPAAGASRDTLAGECSALLAGRLPDYLVPRAVLLVDQLGTGPDGRVDAESLPLPELAATTAYVAPTSGLEQQLCDIWASVLTLDRVGTHDNFFSVGGTSLHCILIQQEILRVTGHGITVTDIFNFPTVRLLAGLLQDDGFRARAAAGRADAGIPAPAGLAADRVSIRPESLPLIELSQREIDLIVGQVPGGADNIQDIYSLTPLQDGILFHYRLAAEGDPYLLGAEISFPTRGQLDAFLSAVQQVVDRHDVLRTAFFWEGLSKPAQVVLRQAALSVTEVALDPRDGPVAGQLRARHDARSTRVDLSRPPLLSYVVAHDPESGRWLVLQRFQHLAGDHVTLEQLRAEVLAILDGRAGDLPPAVPYREMVAHLHGSGSQHGHERFFTDMLGDIREPTLPFGLVDVHRHGGDAAEARLVLAQGLNDRLRAQARRWGVGLASLCHLAWGQVLARAAAAEHAVFGTVLLGRMQAGQAAGRVVGLTINTLPVRVDLGMVGVAKAAREVHARLAGLFQHEQASLALAQRCSALPPKTPLFNSILNYRHSLPESGTSFPEGHVFAGVEFQAVEERTNYPIALSVDDYGDALGLIAQVVWPLSPERICGYMQRALEGLAEALESAPDAGIGTLDVLPPDERRLLLEDWNDTSADYDRGRCVHQLFEDQARRSPDAVALVHAGAGLTYAALNAQANRLANHLLGLGVRPDERIALCAGRGPGMVIGLLAILKAGAAYVPLDPIYPSDRLGRIVADASPRIVLADDAGRAALGQEVLAGRILLDMEPLRPGADGVTAWQDQCSADPRPDGFGADRLAYVIYTSGSTGIPKGVEIEHRQLASFLFAMGSVFNPKASDAWLAVTSVSFDIAALELYLPLASGARVVLAGHEDVVDPARLQRLLAEAGISHMQATPATWNALLASGWQGDRTLTVLCGGESMPPNFRSDFRGKCAALWNMYGPTETTIWSSCARVGLEGSDMRNAPVPIGRPIANTRLYVLDDQARPVPLGAVGELYIGGEGVARGYFDRDELTTEKFLPDPYAGRPGARMYRTGDLVRQLPDGGLVCIGRNDQQVKIRGFRIELGEIEARLLEHASVRECVVTAFGEGGERRLVAYILPAHDGGSESEMALALRAHLQAGLPDYMVPAIFARVDAWPLTPNGKIDRRALPSPVAGTHASQAYEAPREGAEQVLAGLWQDVLKVDRVGRNDDFFELGGHSLLAVSLLARIRQSFGVELSVATLFARYTLSELGQAVVDALDHQPTAAMAGIPSVPRDRPLPLSFAQQRLWFLTRLEGVSARYHIPAALRLRGQLDLAALRRSLDALLARHESLRSVFDTVDGQPVLRLLDASTPFPLLERDLGQADATAAPGAGRDVVDAAFDLARGPLIRGQLHKLAEDDHVLLLTQHHIVSDGWSIGVLSRELGALYRAFRAGQGDPLPPMAIQYPDYAAWQREWLSGERLQRQTRYWCEALAGAPALLELPTDRPRPDQQDLSGAQHPIVLDETLTRALKRLGQEHGTTLFMTLTAAWAAVLSRLSGQEDVVIGTPTANRSHAETSGLIGLFVNTLALRVRLDGSPGVGDLLAQVRAVALAAQDNQDLPFEQVVEALQPPRRLNHTPIFQVLFNWQSNEMQLPDFPGLQVELASTGYEAVKCDLELSLSEFEGRIVGNLAYARSLFDAATIERHAGYLVAMLRAMVEDGSRSVQAVDLVSEHERTLLLDTWNATSRGFPQDVCIHQLFERQVRLAPDATAVRHGHQALSYRQLNAQANQLAHYLVGRGVRPDDRVVICAERSLAMPIGLLAIMKAGAAYVPLDPSYPAERVAQIIEDADARLVLCDAVGRAAIAGPQAPGREVVDIEPVRLQSRDTAWTMLPSDDPRVDGLGWRNLAYVIYTSGSTGRPKGAMNEHRALINRLAWMQDEYLLDPTDVVLQKTSFSFDVSVWEFFWPLLQGATLLVAPPEVHKDPSALIDLIAAEGVTTIHFVPSMLGAFLLTPGAERCTSLRRVICSGEALQPIHAIGCLGKLPSAALHNLYGPTEAAIDVTAWTCPRTFDGGPVPIGKPIANTRIYLLDEALRPVPRGASGELYIGGVGVARGYHNRPELTAERFLADPFAGEPGATMYRTGDLARHRPDGNIEYLGRCDFQVKIRGFRVELGEIEHCLASHALVREAVVLARDEGGEQRIVAYVLPTEAWPDGQEPTAALRAHLAAALPDYMVPAAIVRMPAWPLTPNGKLDRKALPRPDGEAYLRREYEAPQGEFEEGIAVLWQELLQVDRVGRQDGFFELGGSSLLAVRLVSEIHRQMDVRVDLATLFKHPAFGDFARQVLVALIEQQIGAEEFENLMTSEGT